MAYFFFLGYDMLPVPPGKVSVKIRGKNKTLNLINEGEVNLIKTPGLTDISFTAYLPNTPAAWANYDSSLSSMAMGLLSRRIFGSDFSFKKANDFLRRFESAKTSKLPIRLIISRMTGSGLNMLFSTNMLVTVEDYSVEEDAKRYGTDVAVPLKLRQYRPFQTKTATMETDENGNQRLVVNTPRESIDKTIPTAMKITTAASVLEAVKGVSGGALSWRDVALKNDIYNPIEEIQGRVLRL